LQGEGATALITGPVGGTISQTVNIATVCPPIAAGTYFYLITATCPTCSSSTESPSVTVNALPGAPTITLSATPDTLVSGQKPLCAKLHWEPVPGSIVSTVEISSLTHVGTPPTEVRETVASGLGPQGDISVCPESTTVYTATAINAGPDSGSGAATITVNEPVLQTSCSQIIKKMPDDSYICINSCYELGGKQQLLYADLFGNKECSPPLIKHIAIFGEDVFDPALRVPAVLCTPCGITASDGTNEVKSVDCSGNLLPPPPWNGFAFDIELGTHKVKCEKFLQGIEPRGYTIDLGADPCVWTGKRWLCSP
jgi:hypothetical protein